LRFFVIHRYPKWITKKTHDFDKKKHGKRVFSINFQKPKHYGNKRELAVHFKQISIFIIIF